MDSNSSEICLKDVLIHGYSLRFIRCLRKKYIFVKKYQVFFTIFLIILFYLCQKWYHKLCYICFLSILRQSRYEQIGCKEIEEKEKHVCVVLHLLYVSVSIISNNIYYYYQWHDMYFVLGIFNFNQTWSHMDCTFN